MMRWVIRGLKGTLGEDRRRGLQQWKNKGNVDGSGKMTVRDLRLSRTVFKL